MKFFVTVLEIEIATINSLCIYCALLIEPVLCTCFAHYMYQSFSSQKYYMKGKIHFIIDKLTQSILVNCRLIKVTSPNLNHLIVLGAAMLFSSVFLYTFTVTGSEEGTIQEWLCYVSCTVD